MGYTSTEVKRRYNEKTYKRFVADIKIADYERIEAARGDMSRAQLLMKMFEAYLEKEAK